MADEEPVDGRALDKASVPERLVTLAATIEDIDEQFMAARSICENLLPRIQLLEADSIAMGAGLTATSANLDAALQRTDLLSVLTFGEAMEQALNCVQAISKNTDGNPNN